MTWIVSTEVINPWGFCVEEPTFVYNEKLNFEFRATGIDPITGDIRGHRLQIDIDTLIGDYVRRVYNLPDNKGVSVDAVYSTSSESGEATRPRSWGFIKDGVQPLSTSKSFSTEAEALEYVDTLGNPDPIITIPTPDNSIRLFTASWREEIDGILITRNTELDYTGDQVTLYTVNDLVNFLALFCGVTPEEVPIIWYSSPNEGVLDCETSLKATIIDVDGPAGPIEIDIDFTGSSIGDVTVTTIDGDPVVSGTMLENGDGSVTISDNGFISMRNDGGAFFLNEYGTVGFYATGDASLTADNRVQLGVGRTTLTVDSDGFNMSDSTGTVSFTADELSRLKDLLD